MHIQTFLSKFLASKQNLAFQQTTRLFRLSQILGVVKVFFTLIWWLSCLENTPSRAPLDRTSLRVLARIILLIVFTLLSS